MKQDLEKKGHRGCETSRESYLKQVEIIQFKREVKVSHLDSGFGTERRERVYCGNIANITTKLFQARVNEVERNNTSP